MLTILRTPTDHLLAVCEWWMVDVMGQFDPYGKYVWVNDLQINPGVQSLNIIRQVIRDIAHRVPFAVGVYWHRQYQLRDGIRGYQRKQLVKEVMV